MQLVVTATAAVINFDSVAELTAKTESLRSQLAKLPPRSGKQRSFQRSGLSLEIARPVWDELVALRTREAVRDQLFVEAQSDAVVTATGTELEPGEVVEMSEQEIADRELAEREGFFPLSQEQRFDSMTKAQLLEHLTQHGHVAKKSWNKQQLLNAALSWV